MFIWLIAVAVGVFLWSFMWSSNLPLSFGVLIGLVVAWLSTKLLSPLVTNMEDIPLWLPPLPMATVAIILLVYGVVIWIRGNDALPKPKQSENSHH